MKSPLRREDFVGTILNLGDHEVLLTEFLGEGANNVVFGIAPAEHPDDRSTVIRLSKTMPFLEMNTPHYSLRVDERLSPGHPLRLTHEERLHRLADEMIDWAFARNAFLRGQVFREIRDTCINFIIQKISKSADKQQSASAIFGTGTTRHLADEHMLQRIEELLEEDDIVPDFQSTAQFVSAYLRVEIETWKRDGTHRPLSKNLLCLLLGFHFAGYISVEELHQISLDSRIRAGTSEFALRQLVDFVETLTSRSKSAGRRATPEEHAELDTAASSAIAASRFVLKSWEAVGSQPLTMTIRGRLHYQIGKNLALLPGRHDDAREQFLIALAALTEPDSLSIRHDVLLSLALTYPDDSPASNGYLQEVLDIEERLR